MPTSQNGWSANDRSVLTRVPVPGGVLNVRREFASIFEYLAIRWHEEIEPLMWPGTWSYAEKTITGGDGRTLSNHACGGACDFCAPKHPQGTAPARNFTPHGIAVIRSMLEFCEGAIRWGGDYRPPTKPDGMHLEVVKGPRDAELVARVNAKCAAWVAAHKGQLPPTPAPPAPAGPAKLVVDGDLGPATIRRWQQVMGTPVDGVISKPRSSLIEAVQRVLHAAPRTGVVKVDGDLGPKTIRALQIYLGTPVDGVISRPRSSVIEALQRRLNEGRF